MWVSLRHASVGPQVVLGFPVMSISREASVMLLLAVGVVGTPDCRCGWHSRLYLSVVCTPEGCWYLGVVGTPEGCSGGAGLEAPVLWMRQCLEAPLTRRRR